MIHHEAEEIVLNLDWDNGPYKTESDCFWHGFERITKPVSSSGQSSKVFPGFLGKSVPIQSDHKGFHIVMLSFKVSI